MTYRADGFDRMSFFLLSSPYGQKINKDMHTNKHPYNVGLGFKVIQLKFTWIKLVLEGSSKHYNNHNISNNAEYHNCRIKAYQKNG